jgi:hypothetical protein
MSEQLDPSSLIGRLDALVRSYPLVVGAVLVLFLLTTIFGLVSYGKQGWDSVDRQFFWRSDEYGKLHTLHSDYDLRRCWVRHYSATVPRIADGTSFSFVVVGTGCRPSCL